MRMPRDLRLWTADEVSECLPLDDPYYDLIGKLWGFIDDAKNPTPSGGLDESNDDKCLHWWTTLNDSEQKIIVKAYYRQIPKALTGERHEG